MLVGEAEKKNNIKQEEMKTPQTDTESAPPRTACFNVGGGGNIDDTNIIKNICERAVFCFLTYKRVWIDARGSNREENGSSRMIKKKKSVWNEILTD